MDATPNELLRTDARELGRLEEQGDWRPLFLVARCVRPGTGGPRGTGSIDPDGKISARAFGELATPPIQHKRILRMREAWERAANVGLVPQAETLRPGQEVDLDWASLPAPGDFYDGTEPVSVARRARQVVELLADEQVVTAAVARPDARAAIQSAAGQVHRHYEAARVDDDRRRRPDAAADRNLLLILNASSNYVAGADRYMAMLAAPLSQLQDTTLGAEDRRRLAKRLGLVARKQKDIDRQLAALRELAAEPVELDD